MKDDALLTVFDIDGTLTRTTEVDEVAYAEAIRLEWGFEGISTDWGAYEHSTDTGIAAELFRARRGREVTEEELASLRDRFFDLITDAAREEPARFLKTPGADHMLALLGRRGRHAALATGGWTPTARFKLQRAGLEADALPAAFACDARPREEILRLAIRRAEAQRGAPFEGVVYVGDGLWDARAARALGVGFVGVGEGKRAAALEAAGAEGVVADFEDPDRVLHLLERAARPPLA